MPTTTPITLKFLIPFIVIAIIAIPIIIGLYVYKDASSRNMKALTWALIAALVPSLIGFIIYLFVRNNKVS